MARARSGRAERTFNSQVDLAVDVRYFVIDSFYSVLDTVRDFQYLRRCHPGLLLRQSIQSVQRILDISPSD